MQPEKLESLAMQPEKRRKDAKTNVLLEASMEQVKVEDRVEPHAKTNVLLEAAMEQVKVVDRVERSHDKVSTVTVAVLACVR